MSSIGNSSTASRDEAFVPLALRAPVVDRRAEEQQVIHREVRRPDLAEPAPAHVDPALEPPEGGHVPEQPRLVLERPREGGDVAVGVSYSHLRSSWTTVG
jgi:hypothetical protein